LRLNYSSWVFKPPDARFPEEGERWWKECYQPHPFEDLIAHRSQWCVLVGGYQEGKSTALAALRRYFEERALLIQDDFLTRPEPEAAEGNILQRTLSRASWILRQRFGEEPGRFALLSPTQLEFLRWSIEKFHGRRAFLRWLDGLPRDIAQILQTVEYDDLYPSQTSDVGGQIEEMANLGARIAGQRQVLTIVDSPPFPSPEQTQAISHMLEWLEPMQHAELKVVMALPPSFSAQKVRELSRGRVAIFEMESAPDHNREVVSRHLSTATNGKILRIEQLCSQPLTARLGDFLRDEFGSSAVGAWLKMVEILLETINEEEKLLLKIEAFPKIKLVFCERFMPLHLTPDAARLGVWRGYKWIPLDRSVYDFLTILVRYKDKRITHEMVQTTKENLHTLASRLRNAVEPDPLQPIYLKNIKGEGYWLENYKHNL
jgi:hypothetical protein